MTSIIGRNPEIQILKQAIASKTAEFIAIYGRRRVGKTHLIREFFKPQSRIYFSVTGLKDGKTLDQLQIFQEELERVFFGNARLPKITKWREALKILAQAVKLNYETNRVGQITIFLDELPWMATPKSGLIQAMDHVWNTELVQIPVLRLIVCGSAASCIINNLILAKGGLHHRLTRKICLSPFNLAETRLFLSSIGVSLKKSQVLELYMAIGGIAQYLKQVQKGQSATQAVSQICFSKNGYLRDEFELLFKSLFNDAEKHLDIINALASKKSGLSRTEIIEKTGIPSGGRLANWLNELEHAGFIASSIPFGKVEKNTQYQIIDEYVWFYLKWIKKAPKIKDAESYWLNATKTPTYPIWAGLAFEAVCHKHTAQIQKALGIQSLTLQTHCWSFIPPQGQKDEKGAQIDILFDRSDNAITLGEIKYSSDEFSLNKSYANELKNKIEVFEKKTHTRKQVFLALITTHGLKASIWSNELIHQVVTLESLFL